MPTSTDHRDAIAAGQARSTLLNRKWRESPGYLDLSAAFDSVDAADIEAVAALALDLLAAPGPIDRLIDPLIAGLAEEPWFEPSVRVNRDMLRTGVVLFDHPAATISASVLSAAMLAELPPARAVGMSGRLTIVRYARGGGARLQLWHTEPAGRDFSSATAACLTPLDDVALSDGTVLRIDGRTQAAQIVGAVSDVVSVTISVRAAIAPFQREYALPSGALSRVATTDDGASRSHMLLTYLRHAKRADAAALFDAATRDGAFFLRWAAMREWLALDVAGALPRLREMTRDPNAEVRAAAEQTRPMAEAACRG